MRRPLHKLSAKAVEQQKRTGYFSDGGGLYLQVSPTHSKSWIFRFTLHGKQREMGLGSINAIGLAEARRRAGECRSLLHDGVDPIAVRNAVKAQEALTKAKAISFDRCSEAYVESQKAGWRNAKHTAQWTSTLKTYASPMIGVLPVQDIDTALVLKVLEPIWTKKAETASRLRGRIESVLDWAGARGYRTGQNPARWRGHLDMLLPAQKRDLLVKHHAALPYTKVGTFIEKLRVQEGTAARALEFAILTAARTGEVIGAQKVEFDFDKAIWTIPPGRMKASREHRVPLCARALTIVREQLKSNADAAKLGAAKIYVFPGLKANAPLSNMAMLALLKRMGRDDLTVHGFRSTFRDWGAEQTAYPSELLEMALAHTIGNKVEAAYRRGDLFEKRMKLMKDWEKYCERGSVNNVVELNRARRP
jgi:integrase